MKKCLSVMLILLFVLTGCSTKENDGAKDDSTIQNSAFFEGVIEELNENTAIVFVEGDWDITSSGDRVSVDLSVNQKETFVIGDVIKVTYDGTIGESYPLSINVIGVEKSIDD